MTCADAADAVYKRANDNGVIELSNIDEGDSAQVAVTVDVTGAQPVNAAPVGSLAKQAAPTSTKTGSAAEEDANVAEGCTERELAEGQSKEACDKKKLARASAGGSGNSQMENSGNYSGGSMGSVNYGAPPVASTGTTASTTTGSNNTTIGTGASASTGTMAGTGSTAGTGTAAGTGTTADAGTTSGTGNTNSAGTGTTNGTGTTAGTGTVDTALAATLQQYRQLMLQEAAAANINDNHAVSRRYLMTNRSTYQAAIGVVVP